MSLDYEEIGRNIRMSRLRKHLRQADLAEMIDVSAQYVSHIECGKNKVSLDVLVRIGQALSINLYTLIGENDKSHMEFAFTAEIDNVLKNLSLAQRALCLELCRAVESCKTLEE